MTRCHHLTAGCNLGAGPVLIAVLVGLGVARAWPAGTQDVTLISRSGELSLECNQHSEVMAIRWGETALPLQGRSGWYLRDERQASEPQRARLAFGAGPAPGQGWRAGDDWQVDRLARWEGEPIMRWRAEVPCPSSRLERIVPVTPGAVCEIRWAVRADLVASGLQLEVREEDESGSPLDPFHTLPDLSTDIEADDGAGWQILTFRWSPLPPTRQARLTFQIPYGQGRLELGAPEWVAYPPPPERWWGEAVAAGEAAGSWQQRGDTWRWQGKWTAADLQLAAEWEPLDHGWRLQAVLESLSPESRGLTLGFRLPLVASDWSWWHSLSQRTPVADRPWVGDWVRWGQEWLGSQQPLACMTRGAWGIAWGLSLDRPALHRLFTGLERGFSIEWDAAWSATEAGRPLRLEAVLLHTNGRWGWRSAWERWRAVQPAGRGRRVAMGGSWLSGIWPEAAPEPRLLGLGFDETPGTWAAWERRQGLLPFAFLSPFGVWVTSSAPTDVARTVQEGRSSQEWLAGLPGEVRLTHVPSERHPWQPEQRYWPLNPFVEPWSSQIEAAWQQARSDALAGVALPELGAAERGWQAVIPPGVAWPQRVVPWVWSRAEQAPRQVAGWLFWDFLRTRPEADLRLGRVAPGPFLFWLAPLLDVVVGEPAPLPFEEWAQQLRLAAGDKPVSVDWPSLLDRETARVEAENVLQRGLPWAVWIGDGPWVDRQQISYLQSLLVRYSNWLAYLHHLGWQPLPYATANVPTLYLERFGYGEESVWVAWNPEPTAVQARLSFEADWLQAPGKVAVFYDLTQDRPLYAFREGDMGWILGLALNAQQARILRWQRYGAFEESWLDLPIP